MIIHISGFPGSGKTTLGEKIQKLFGSQIIVYDTDLFIQHNNDNGKKLLEIEKQIKTGTKRQKDYTSLWRKIIKKSINDIVKKYPNKPIIFVGSLDNFAPNNLIYKIKAEHKIVLDVPLYEIMKRYYLRIYKTEQTITKKQSEEYWKNLSNGVYNISSSNDIIKNYGKYMKWHNKNDYIVLSDNEIIKKLKKWIN
tara:strand:- start:135 stop:719 length:585 start_codon:yes stop_codon:yes gene_type:complete